MNVVATHHASIVFANWGGGGGGGLLPRPTPPAPPPPPRILNRTSLLQNVWYDSLEARQGGIVFANGGCLAYVGQFRTGLQTHRVVP